MSETTVENYVFGWPILKALQRKHMYLGTVSDDTIAKRRAANKVARKQRRINRLTAKH